MGCFRIHVKAVRSVHPDKIYCGYLSSTNELGTSLLFLGTPCFGIVFYLWAKYLLGQKVVCVLQEILLF